MTAFRQSLAILSEKPFRNFFLGRTISKFGSALTPLALTFGILNSGGSAADLGIVLAAATVPQLLLLLIGGVVGDRFERRLILVVSDVVLGCVQAITAVLLLSNSATVWHLALLQFIGGCADAFFNPASSGAIRDFVGASRVQEARSLLGITGSTVRIVGPAVAGIIIATSNAGIALALDSITFFISAVFLLRVQLPSTRLNLSNSLKTDLVEGWREVISRSWVWGYILLACLFQATSLPALSILGPLLAKTELGGPAAWALVLSAQSFGALASGFILLRWRPDYPMKMAVILCSLSVPLLLVLAIPGVPIGLLLLPAFIAGATLPMGDNLWFVALAEHIPDQAQSRVSSYDWLGSLALAPVGYALMGKLAVMQSPSTILLVVAAMELAATTAALRLKGVRELRRLHA